MSSTYNFALHRLGTQQMKIILTVVVVVSSALDCFLLTLPDMYHMPHDHNKKRRQRLWTRGKIIPHMLYPGCMHSTSLSSLADHQLINEMPGKFKNNKITLVT